MREYPPYRLVDDYKNAEGLWVKSQQSGGFRNVTKSYKLWNNMSGRCGSRQAEYPAYKGCFTSDNFKDFQYFVNWRRQQIGGLSEGYQLDKDILVYGNKMYGEDTCVFVPREINYFFITPQPLGQYPPGVYWSKQANKIAAQITCSGNKRIGLGYFDNVEAAAQAYKVAKEAEARRWYERARAGEFELDGRVLLRLKNWTLPNKEVKCTSQG